MISPGHSHNENKISSLKPLKSVHSAKNEREPNIESPLKSSGLASSKQIKENNSSSSPPPKFGIRPNNSRIMFMKNEVDSHDLFKEKLKQAELKEFLEYIFLKKIVLYLFLIEFSSIPKKQK